MTSPEREWNDVLKRLESLERQNRRLKQIGAVALAAIAALVLMSQAVPRRIVEAQTSLQRTVEASEFILRDTNGRERASLELLEGAPMLMIYDESANPRAIVGYGKDAAFFSLSGADGKVQANLQANSSGSFLALYDADEKERLGINFLEGYPFVRLVDQEGNPRVAIGAPIPGNLGTGLLVVGETGKAKVRVGFLTEEPAVGLTDQDENLRLLLYASKDGANVSLVNKSQEVVGELHEDEDGSVQLNLNDAYGQRRVVMRMGPQGPMLVVGDENQKTLWKAP